MSFVGPYPVEDVIERIRQKVPLAKEVGGAASLEAALSTPPNAAVALFVVCTERGGQNKYTSIHIQNADVQVSVVLLVRSSADERRGAGAVVKTSAVIKELREAILGWTPSESFDALSFTASRDDSYKQGWQASQQVFASSYRIQNQPVA